MLRNSKHLNVAMVNLIIFTRLMFIVLEETQTVKPAIRRHILLPAIVRGVFLTPAEWTIHLGTPVVPEEYMMKSGWLKGSCSKLRVGTTPSAVRPEVRNPSIRHLHMTIRYGIYEI